MSTAAPSRSAVLCSDVVETVTSETEAVTWLKFRDETETVTLL